MEKFVQKRPILLSGFTPTRRQAVAGLAAGVASPFILGRASADDRKPLKVMSWEQFQPGEKDGWNALFDKFNASQSKYKVDWTGWPAGQYISNVVVQAQAGGIDADVLMAMPDLAAQVIRKFKLALPLDSIVSDLGITPSGGHAFLKQDGKLYGLSAIDVNFALVYNKELFDKAGVKPSTTAEEWVDTTGKLTHRPDQFGIALTNAIADGGEWWFQLQNFCLPFDGKWADGKTPMANSPETIKGMELWKALYDAGTPQGTAESAITKLTADGRIAQAWGVTPTVVVLRATNPDIYPKLLSAPPPWASKRSLDRIHPLIALKSSKNQDGAMDFIKFAMAPEQMAALMETNLYVIPPYDLAAKSEQLQEVSCGQAVGDRLPGRQAGFADRHHGRLRFRRRPVRPHRDAELPGGFAAGRFGQGRHGRRAKAARGAVEKGLARGS